MSLPDKVKTNPESVSFAEVIEYIDSNFTFTPTRFTNGETVNEANQNNGSCKIFYFAKMHSLSQEQTLQLFGEYYRIDVLQHPDRTDHQNIRNFMKFGWKGIHFDNEALR
ncbi:HopJ type III effector protein [Flavobacterium suncheonense]|nr:HopJ type III effector protein [Flavobacterium suncheonense]